MRAAILFAVWLWLAATAAAQPPAPEAATGFSPRPAVRASNAMVVTAHPLATDAALAVLGEGGSAADAAIAAALVLNVVEPQSSGIGGGGFLLHYDAAAQRLAAWDGRESAPAAVEADWFLDEAGRPLHFFDAVVGGRAVGVPGLPRLLEAAHRRHGVLPWARLFAPAIALAREGFAVSPRLHAHIARDRFLRADPAARLLFFDAGGAPLAVGATLRNPALAATLELLARDGAEAFYGGEVARDLVAAVARAPAPGALTLDDLRSYEVVERPALCGPYRAWRVCGMPPPSAGGASVLALLGVLQRFDLPAIAPDSAFAAHLFAEAGRLAYADREAWYGDPAAMTLAPAQLLAPRYLARRAALIALDGSMGTAPAGVPDPAVAAVAASSPEWPATTHISVVDAGGNAVSLTASIENAFGSRRMVRGFLLNNQLTDFSFVPSGEHGAHPNRAGPRKRPLSSMAPTLVFAPDGRLHAVLGSPGGSAIINYVAAALVGVLDWGQAPDAALARPHAGSRNGPTEVEDNAAGCALAGRLALFGHRPQLRDLTSGTSLIVREAGGWAGAADPRREGSAAGY
ncbi:Ggt protein [Azoarcus olearius]|uniref:gamma-glutamyltransferase n=1 Tax=Azoarcus sp. (strain BH72) TaxID=418699 RepID=UPI0008062881|nr:gamma-glutamyltransferase [Azoarcus olearius]ANQ84642.1 Ggt protein [Azoarcus olearius]